MSFCKLFHDQRFDFCKEEINQLMWMKDVPREIQNCVIFKDVEPDVPPLKYLLHFGKVLIFHYHSPPGILCMLHWPLNTV